MWKLTIEDDEGKQTSLPLAHDEYALGRGEANAIRLTDRNVSRKHAVLKRNGQGWVLKDLTSYNGTYVNGVRVVEGQLVQSGDVVQLGDYRLELLDEAAAQPTTNEPSVAVAPTLVPTSPVHQRPDRMVVVVGPNPGAEYPLDKEHFTIGRSEEATISINHSSVSRVHAELHALGNGRFEIVDKASANGIRINGVELRRGILEAGDALELGDVRLRFVGAGKIFRAGADQSQQLSAVGTFESVAPSVRAPAPTTPRPAGMAWGKVVGFGAFIAIALVLVFFLVSHAGGTTNTTDPQPKPTAAPATSEATKALKEAYDLLGKDLEAAHLKATALPESVRDDAQFKEIEAAWADAIFKQADATEDRTEKRRLYKKIAETQTVDAGRRTRAASELQKLDATEPPPPQSTFDNSSTSGGRPVGTGATTTAPSTTPSVKATATAAPPGTIETDPEKIKARLIGRLANGKISEGDLILLRAACRQIGDTVCKNACDQAIKKKQSESPYN